MDLGLTGLIQDDLILRALITSAKALVQIRSHPQVPGCEHIFSGATTEATALASLSVFGYDAGHWPWQSLEEKEHSGRMWELLENIFPEK